MPGSAPSLLAYRLLAGLCAGLCLVLGLLFLVAFLDRVLFQVLARPLFPMNHWGYYVLGFAGTALIAWGGCLVAATRAPERTRGIGTATAIALVIGAMLRLLGWYSGEYGISAEDFRSEAAVMTALALGFVWLRPPATAAAGDRPQVAGKIGVTLLCLYLVAVSVRIGGCHGPEGGRRDDRAEAGPAVGTPFPDFAMRELSGATITREMLGGAPALLLLAPSLDWSPPTKARVLDYAAALGGDRGVRAAVVLTAAQATARSRAFATDQTTPFYYLVDADGLLGGLGLTAPGPDGAPAALSATFLLDAEGVVRLRDVRTTPRRWLAPAVVLDALAALG